jgi:hypothetical protein
MPVPDFSPGEVLTAAAMDSIGMWRVGGGALSGTATDFVGCFTSTYTNYRIVVDSISLSGGADLLCRFLVGSTPETSSAYRYASVGLKSNGTNYPISNDNATFMYPGLYIAGVTDPIGSMTLDVLGPQLAQRSLVQSSIIGFESNIYTRTGMNSFGGGTQFNGIRFYTGSAVTMGGTVSIYGYRKA